MRATLVIVNYNGRHLLEKSLPAAAGAAHFAGDHAVAVADDGSTDDSLGYVVGAFPQVNFLAYPRRGFGATCNRAVADADTEVVVLLNSDVVVAPDFLPPLLADLEDPGVAAVGCRFLNPDGSLTDALGNRTSGEWRGGMLFLHHETDPARLTDTCPQLYPNGGAFAFRRARWLELGGFDDLYHPFYWEDADLGYRAWARGWRVLYEPRSVVYHAQGGTIARVHRTGYIERTTARNALLFAWKNLLDPQSLRRTLRAQGRWTADDVLIGGLPNRLGALCDAAKLLRPAARRRSEERRARVVSDAEILVHSRAGGDEAAAPDAAAPEAPAAEAAEEPSTGHVLLLTFARRGEEEAIRAAIAALQERHPQARLLAVGTPVSEPVLRGLGVGRVLVYSKEHPARRVLEEAQLCMPEATAVVYQGEDLRGHLKLEALALAVGARETLRCRLTHPPMRVGRLRLGAIVLGKALHLAARTTLGMVVAAAAYGVLRWYGRGGGNPDASRP